MKKISLYISSILSVFALTAGCTSDSDIENHQTKKTLFIENFDDNTDNTELNTPGWTNIAQIGTRKWTEQTFYSNGYAEFTSFGSGQPVNIGWLISPAFDMNAQEGETLVFQAAHAFLTSADNTLELMVSTDYDGIPANFNNSSWLSLPVITPKPTNDFYDFINSGEVDLSGFEGTLHFAFKVRGSGSNNSLDATYQIDNIRLFY